MSQTTLEAPLSAERSRSASPLRVLGWAAYLACSWTWCIGMFLPVLLVRDYGVWGWVVFAVPNVLGAAAMGWVLRSGEQGRRLMEPHVHACLAFSLVTLAFHLFFVTWLLEGAGLLATVPLAAVMYAGIWRREQPQTAIRPTDDRALWLAAGVFVLSFAALVFVGAGTTGWDVSRSADPLLPLLSLAPVSVLGFLLCPYLDLTFHRARQANSPGGARVAFGVGFGLLFLLMIAFTLLYAPLLIAGRQDVLFLVVGAHVAVQSAFTMALHHRAMEDTNPLLEPDAYAQGMRPDFHPFWRRGRVLALITAFALGVAALFHKKGLSGIPGEAIYRGFMGFYGLAFPAYVWLCIVPTWRDPRPPGKRTLAVFAVAVLLAAPMYWMGFIERQMVWLLPGVAVVLLARLAVPRQTQPSAPVNS